LHHLNRVKLGLANQYIILFKSLTEGEHEFEFDLKKAFFDEYEVLEAKDGFIKVFILLTKKPRLLSLDIKMTGFIEIPCDRCLEYFNYSIELKNNLLVKFSEDDSNSNEEIWTIHPNEYELNLEQYFFDCIAVGLPLQKIHPDVSEDGTEGCNKNMLNILNKHLYPETDQKNIDDPRWNKLKNLLNDNNNN